MNSSERVRLRRGVHLRTTRSGRIRRAIAVGCSLALTLSMASFHYQVEPGDTLSEIARDLGFEIDELVKMNGIEDPDYIVDGMELNTDGSDSDDSSSGGETYIVQAGDTLGDIAWEFGVSTSALRDANGLDDADYIVEGMTLVIPSGSGGGDDGSDDDSSDGGGDSVDIGEIFGYHVVQPGETLAGIASHYGTTVRAIAAANGITDTSIVYVDARLALAEEVDSGSDDDSDDSHGATHTVQNGETLLGIALEYGVSVSALVEINDLADGDDIVIGDVLTIPEGGGSGGSEDGGAGGAGIVCPVAGPADFVNDWGLPRSGGRYHQGNDLFAAAGTPVVAPVSGNVILLTGTIGGKQYSLYGDDGNTYWGTHLGGFGNSGVVNAGDVLGYVGASGNAVGTPPHLHFEIHPGGGGAVNPYPTLVASGC